MRRIINAIVSKGSLIVFAAAMSMALPHAASAQDRYMGRLPDGDYRDTCRDIRLDRDRLTATCRGKYGGWYRTSLDMRDCRGGMVENRDSNLVCVGGYRGGRDDYGNGGGYGGGYGGGFGGGLPEGGYRDSCRQIDVDRGVLTAYCRTKDGDWNFSTLNLRDCRGGVVENKRGTLVCRGR